MIDTRDVRRAESVTGTWRRAGGPAGLLSTKVWTSGKEQGIAANWPLVERLKSRS